MIREQDPLKQGLKPNNEIVYDLDRLIREQDPLKQGLKLEIQSFGLVAVPDS